MKRSGNHAVIDWICRQGSVLFYNNIIPIKPILDGTRPMPEPRDLGEFLSKRVGGKFARARHCLRHLMVSLEDHALETVPFRNVRQPVTNVIVLRDPKNLFASRIRKAFAVDHPAYPREVGPLMDRVVALWKAHAREFLGDTSVLDNKVTISFDAWFASIEYRKIVSSKLGFKHRDSEVARVPGLGGGSSFDGVSYDGEGARMQVLKRAEQLDSGERSTLEEIFRDDELVCLSKRYANIKELAIGRSIEAS